MAIDPYANCATSVPPEGCTLQTCCLAQSSFLYLPSYGGNLFFACYFGFLIMPQVAIGAWFRTWGFMVGMVVGLALEVIGYAARVQLHNSPFDSNPFLMYLITLTIAPVFISAAIYLCLTRIIVLYGKHLTRFEPRTIAIVFMSSDFLSLILQAIGGAIADTANDRPTEKTGTDIMVAGLILQAVSLAVFLLVVADFAWRCHRGVLNMDADKRRTRGRPLLKLFMISLLLAAVAVLIRSIFRAAELWEGFGGKLWNNEVDFMVLDGAMIGIAASVLTVFHPGPSFGGQWHAADWSFKTKKGRVDRGEFAAEMKG